MIVDSSCAVTAGLIGLLIRFHSYPHPPWTYIGVTLALPIVWWLAVALAGGYDSRFIGVGSDEFRRVFNAGVCLTAGAAIVMYATKSNLSRGYLVLALPLLTLLTYMAGLRSESGCTACVGEAVACRRWWPPDTPHDR